MRSQKTDIEKHVTIVIGGTFGSGKTVLAHRLCSRLKIFRCIEIGPIVETLKLYSKWRDLASRLDFWSLSPRRYLSIPEIRSIARPINRVVSALLEHCDAYGTAAVAEGVELFPSILGFRPVTLWVYLTPPNARVHYRRLVNPRTHTKRSITKSQFEYVQALDRMLRIECKRFDIPILRSAPLHVLENQVIKLIGERRLVNN